MRWLDNIYQLGYYTHTAQTPCYCEKLLFANDLVLQSALPSVAGSGYTLSVSVYSADGLTEYENANSYFSSYFFNQNGTIYFNLQLNSFTPAMCGYACWILRVSVTLGGVTVFDKYTDRYCQVNCCDVPRGITISDVSDPTYPIDVPIGEDPVYVTDDCGRQYVTISGVFSCYSLETGQIFGIPSNVTQGSASFPFTLKTNFVGRIVERPRTIERIISYNCSLQRSDSFIPFLLEQTQEPLFPSWKMREIEAMFHADSLFVNGSQYQFAGGTLFTQPLECWELFKLETTLQTCNIRQTFGCTNPCNGIETLHFLIPSNYTGGAFYGENGLIIANDFDELLLWYQGQPGVTDVVNTSGTYANTAYSFHVTYNGFIPASFYYDRAIPRNRIFGINPPVAPVVNCVLPELGAAVVETAICDTPSLDTPVVEDVPDETYAILDYGDWVQDGSEVVIASGAGNMSIDVDNVAFSPGETVILGNEVIGVITYGGRPTLPMVFTNDENSDIPVGATLYVNINGQISYSGSVTADGGGNINITINNIIYGA